MRKTKQFIFGIVFLAILVLVLWGLYSIIFPSNPSCFNNKQDQGEVGIDCGGPCLSCELKSLKPIEVKFVKLFEVSDGVGLVAEIYNPNISWSAKNFSYSINLKDSFGAVVETIKDSSFAYAGDLKYVVKPYIQKSPSQITQADLIIENPTWVKVTEFSKPDVKVGDIKTYKNEQVFVSGKMTNSSEKDFSSANIYALTYNQKGELLAGSATVLDDIPKLQSKTFSVSFSKEFDIYQLTLDISFFYPVNLKLGDSGKNVGNLQAFLAEIGLIQREPTQYYDDLTRQAMASFQQQTGLVASGEFDEPTRKFLVDMINSQISQIPQKEIDKLIDPSKTKVFFDLK
ncbi:MAG: peptidoglycan-binding domain-containing protein [Candidatus Paceibacterota bacterium]|jgi:hypothetical protein